MKRKFNLIWDTSNPFFREVRDAYFSLGTIERDGRKYIVEKFERVTNEVDDEILTVKVELKRCNCLVLAKHMSSDAKDREIRALRNALKDALDSVCQSCRKPTAKSWFTGCNCEEARIKGAISLMEEFYKKGDEK